MFKSNKGISLIALIITMIVMIIIAMISFLVSRDAVTNSYKSSFLAELTDFKRGLDVYNTRAYIRGVDTYNSDELFWNGDLGYSPINTAKITDHMSEDTLETIFGRNNFPNILKDKIYILEGELYVYSDCEPEYDWAMDDPRFSYMENSITRKDVMKTLDTAEDEP